jgi:hypothetical protein
MDYGFAGTLHTSLLHLLNSFPKWVLSLSLFYKGGNWSTERLNAWFWSPPNGCWWWDVKPVRVLTLYGLLSGINFKSVEMVAILGVFNCWYTSGRCKYSSFFHLFLFSFFIRGMRQSPIHTLLDDIHFHGYKHQTHPWSYSKEFISVLDKQLLWTLVAPLQLPAKNP